MARLENFPRELLVMILGHLHGPSDLAACLLTCRGFLRAFETSPLPIATSIVRGYIPPDLLPCAVAVLCWIAPELMPRWPSPLPVPEGKEVASLVRPVTLVTYYVETPDVHAACLADLVCEMSATALLRLGAVHEAVHGVVGYFSADAWASVVHGVDAAVTFGDADDPSGLVVDPGLSPTEYLRFCRVFYKTLYYSRAPEHDEAQELTVFAKCITRPSQEEQLQCVAEFMERMEDQIWGVGEIFCASISNPTNKFINQSLLQVARFQRLALGDPSHEPRFMPDLLDSVEMQKRTQVVIFHWGKRSDGVSLTARGPYRSDGTRREDRGPGHDANKGLRRCAYVFWDLERAEEAGLVGRADFCLKR